MTKAILLGLFCFLLFLVIHVLVFRFFELKERFVALTKIFFGVSLVYVTSYYLVPAEPFSLVPTQPINPRLSLETINLLSNSLNFISGLMLYIFLFLGYCQFYFIVDRSISVRVMIEIEKSPGKKLTFEEIQKIYCFNEILSRRLGHMEEGKYVDLDSGYYTNTSKGKFQAKLFSFLKEFLKLGAGG